MKEKLLFIVVLLYFSFPVSGQKIIPVLELGSSYSFASQTFDQLGGNYPEIKAYGGVGWNASLAFLYRHSSKIFFKAGLSYDNRNTRKKESFMLYDNSSNPIRSVENLRISNNYLNLNLLVFFRLSEKFSTGTGISNHFLLFSRTHIPDFKKDFMFDQSGNPAPAVYRNYYFKKYNFSIPFSVQFEGKRILVWLLYDHGLFSRLPKDIKVKERESSFQIGLGYKLIKE